MIILKDYLDIQNYLDALIELVSKHRDRVIEIEKEYSNEGDDDFDFDKFDINLDNTKASEKKLDFLIDNIDSKIWSLDERYDKLSDKHFWRLEQESKTYQDEERKLFDIDILSAQYKIQSDILNRIDNLHPYTGFLDVNQANQIINSLIEIKKYLILVIESVNIIEELNQEKLLKEKLNNYKIEVESAGYKDDVAELIDKIEKKYEFLNVRKEKYIRLINEKKEKFKEIIKEFSYSDSLVNDFNQLYQAIYETDMFVEKKLSFPPNIKSALLHYQPKTIDNLKLINGVNEGFIDCYGKEIIELFNKYVNNNDIKTSLRMTPDEQVVIEKLKNRLVNINQRNKLLFNGKLMAGKSVDLVKNFENVEELLKALCLGKKTKFCIFDFSLDNNGKIQNESFYRSLNKLERESKEIEKEKGSDVLYVAYPFAEGKLLNDDFNIKSPLILFPVNLIREKNNYYINFDENRDIIYNTTLILANNKSNNKNLVLPSASLDECSYNHLIDDAIDFYNINGLSIEINKEEDDFLPFIDHKFSEFPKYQYGEIFVKNYCVLGVFPNYVTSIYSDFQKLLENNLISSLIQKLLSSQGDISFSQTDNEVVMDSKIDNEINSFRKTDYSQEKIMKDIKEGKSLVIQGPPGTGKSQTIANVIVQSILDNKKILMVSEKKAALDVIYSRLGNLSNFAVLLDDMEDKNEFFGQIKKIIEYSNATFNYNKNEVENTNSKIAEEFNKLYDIENKIYKVNDFGLSIENILHNCNKYDFSNEKELQIYEYLEKKVNYISNLKYNELFELYNFVDKYLYNENIKYIVNILCKYKWLKKLKNNLTEYEILSLKKTINELIEKLEEYKSYNFIKKIKIKKELIKELNNIYTILFFENIISYDINEENINLLKEIQIFLPDYLIYLDNNEKYAMLSKDQKEYFKLNVNVSEQFDIGIIEANKLIYNHCMYRQIEKFIKDNANVLNYIDTYESIISNIDENINKKESMVSSIAINKLYDEHKKLSINNNIKEMERQASKKKFINIKEFVSKYKLELMDSIKIWLLTPEVVSSIMPLEENLFDIVIFDEASQLFVEKTIPSIYRANQIVIAGDDKQLKPSLLGVGRIDDIEDEYNDYSGSLEEESLLGLAKYRFESKTLNFHYRAKYEELINFSNYAFYNTNLAVSPNRVKLLNPPIERIKVENGLWVDKKNDEEAKKVVELIKKLLLANKDFILSA